HSVKEHQMLTILMTPATGGGRRRHRRRAVRVSVLPAAATRQSPPAKAAARTRRQRVRRQARQPCSRSTKAETGTPTAGAVVRSLTSAPTTQYSSAALEASGHSDVRTGRHRPVGAVDEAPPAGRSPFLNVRASIPDSASGGGATATLNLYVDGVFRQALNLNSLQSWVYEGQRELQHERQPEPGRRRPEGLLGRVAHLRHRGPDPGRRHLPRCARESANTASFYDIDSVDVENPPAPQALAGELDLDHELRRRGGRQSHQRRGRQPVGGQPGRHPELHRPGRASGQDPAGSRGAPSM
ncbi:hypothetical protein ACRAWF_21880, partial [Streptomyces sp. L7]